MSIFGEKSVEAAACVLDKMHDRRRGHAPRDRTASAVSMAEVTAALAAAEAALDREGLVAQMVEAVANIENEVAWELVQDEQGPMFGTRAWEREVRDAAKRVLTVGIAALFPTEGGTE